MAGSIAWKGILSIAVLAWAILNIIPVRDTPFVDFIQSQVTAEEEEFQRLHSMAQERVDSGESATFFLALREVVEAESADLQSFFPEIDARDIRNLDKRNKVLLDEILTRSHGKVKPGLDLNGGVAFSFRVSEETPVDLPTEADDDDRPAITQAQKEYDRSEQLGMAVEILRKRIDGLGVAEPVIRLVGDNHIEVQMPGVSIVENPDVGDKISAPARLDFCLVHRTANPLNLPEPPIGYRAMIQKRENSRTGEIEEIPYYIKKIPEMGGEIIAEARAVTNEFGGYRVLLSFTDDGDERFGDVTKRIAEENERTRTVGQLAIILDGELYSAPTVRAEIRGGAEITGHTSFTQREAQELANVLNNPLRIGLDIEEMNVIGPSLAEDARDASFVAFQIGAALVIIFMILYYVFAGVVAVISVLINVAIVFGTLSSIGATVTLPGVAALVLTLGMAVDANILIFERIREELREGKNLGNALISGYGKALSTIVDANVTTLITASILIWLGTGAVRGFGVTLAIGIVTSMFCALLVSRVLLEILIHSGLVKKMLSSSLLPATEIPFLIYSKRAFVASWCVVLVGIVAIAGNRQGIFGIDFLGGEELTFTYSEKLTSQQVEAVARDANLGEVNILYQSAIGSQAETLKIQTEHGTGERFLTALQESYPGAGLEHLGQSRISPTVGKEVTFSALTSISLALVGILLYVALRFEIGYGIGAVVATIHDILMSIGLYVLLGSFGVGSGQFTAPMVAAILMIIGYSLNDSIVVFDRVREELLLHPGRNLASVINLAINRTLARTILTSVTTLLATSALYLFGAGVVIDFALVFIIGIFTGTFSSIFIASPVFFWWHKGDRRHVEERHDILPKYEWETSKKMAQ